MIDALLPPRRMRLYRGAGWTLAGVTVVGVAISVLLFLINADSLPPTPGQPWIVVAIAQVGAPAWAAAAMAFVGALIVQRTPAHGFAWAVLLTTTTIGLVMAAQEYAVIGLIIDPGSLPAAEDAAWLQTIGYYLMPLQLFIAMLLFPTGELFSKWLLPAIPAAALVTAIFLLARLDGPSLLTPTIRPSVALPVTMPPELWGLGAVFSPLYWPTFWLTVALPVIGAVFVCVRLLRARSTERDQLRWIALAGIAAAAGWATIYVPQVFGDSEVTEVIANWGSVLWIAGICVGTPVTVSIAILRYNVYDIDRVLAQGLLYGGLAVSVTALYIVIVFGVGARVGTAAEPVLSLMVTIIVAIALAPVRDRLQVLANRIVYGRRASPLEVLSLVAQSMDLTPAIDDTLPRIASLVGRATNSQSVEVWLRDEDDLRLGARWPDSVEGETERRLTLDGSGGLPTFSGTTRVLPVRVDGELLGCIAVTQPSDRGLTPSEESLLAAIASHAGLLLRNVRLVADLRASRQRVLTAGADQRRRLERDLHDGAQQHLVTASLALGLARAQLAGGETADLSRSLSDATEQLRQGLAELRDLARGLYPAVLTRAGLAPALASLAEAAPIPVRLEVDLDGRLAPIVEATGYYVVSEALTNVAKHAGADRAVVRASVEAQQLVIDVEDDGRGGAVPTTGSGLRGLEDRVATLGGTLTLRSVAGQGTTVHAELPCG